MGHSIPAHLDNSNVILIDNSSVILGDHHRGVLFVLLALCLFDLMIEQAWVLSLRGCDCSDWTYFLPLFHSWTASRPGYQLGQVDTVIIPLSTKSCPSVWGATSLGSPFQQGGLHRCISQNFYLTSWIPLRGFSLPSDGFSSLKWSLSSRSLPRSRTLPLCHPVCKIG